jgi:uncharacterized protein (TIGR02466 family)
VKENIKLFPTLVTRYHSFVDEDRRKKIFDYILECDGYQTHKALKGEVQTNFDPAGDFLHNVSKHVAGCEDIKQTFEFLANEYARDFGMRQVKLANSWYTLQHEGSVLKNHTHPNSIVSAAIYIHCDHNSSSISFDNPNSYLQSLLIQSAERDTEFTYDYADFKMNAGDIILFPSWLAHGSNYKENQTKNRAIISFNTQYV